MKRLLLLFTLLIALSGLALLYGLQWVEERLDPVGPVMAPVQTVLVPTGATTREVAEQLFAAGLIRDPLVFRYYARRQGLDGRIQSGEYHLSPGMSVAEILDRLVQGEVVEYSVTIPEGLTVAEVAERLAAAGLVDAAEFRQAVAASQAANLWLPDDAPLKEPMEGYLFPATYRYRRGVTAADLVQMMTDRFQAVWTPEYMARAEALGLGVHEVVTLASIVEEEAQVPEERPVIAGVYLNRLGIGMKLDADPTVRYAVQKPIDEELTLDDLQVEDPYNTYRVAGLPPGPIANPGEESIRAVLWPAKHEYLYFVAKGDGSGEHRFSETFAEHLAAMDQAERERAGRP